MIMTRKPRIDQLRGRYGWSDHSHVPGHFAYNTGMSIGIYIHVPYCRSRCPYCDFVSEAVPGTVPERYVEALCVEILAFEGPREAISIFFGGGTPSIMTLDGLARVFEALRTRFVFADAVEITLEANPDDVTGPLVESSRGLGVNRLSLGVQSFDDRVLRYLGRRHDAERARDACRIAALIMPRWSLDLIYGGRPAEVWEGTLKEAVSFGPGHISVYGLTYEDGTPFGERRKEALEDDEALAYYQAAERILAGYEHYEISNYAVPGQACRHNLIYWHNEEYAGFGTGAYSFLDGVRSRNRSSAADYLRNPGEKEERLALSPHEIRLETVIQHLRLRAGLSRDYYRRRFGEEVEQEFGDALRLLVERGLIVLSEERIQPTAEGYYLNNEIGLALVGREL